MGKFLDMLTRHPLWSGAILSIGLFSIGAWAGSFLPDPPPSADEQILEKLDTIEQRLTALEQQHVQQKGSRALQEKNPPIEQKYVEKR